MDNLQYLDLSFNKISNKEVLDNMANDKLTINTFST